MIKKYFKLLFFLFGFIFVLGVNINFTNDFDDLNFISNDEFIDDNNSIRQISEDFRFEKIRILFLNLFDSNNQILINDVIDKKISIDFFNDIKKYKNLGEYIGCEELFLFENFDNQKEIRSILNFQNGNLTINFIFDDLSKKIIDYYMTKGKNHNQYLGIKYFKMYFFIFIIIIFVIIMIFNIYKKFKINIDNNKKANFLDIEYSKDKDNNTELVAIIMAALSNYLRVDANKLHIKSIKKTGWKKRY